MVVTSSDSGDARYIIVNQTFITSLLHLIKTEPCIPFCDGSCDVFCSQLSDWWLKVAYLDYRMPVVIHSSPGVVLPRLQFSDRQDQIRSDHVSLTPAFISICWKSFYTDVVVIRIVLSEGRWV